MKRERRIRLHALRQGDEVFHDSRWWLVGPSVGPHEFEIKRGSKVIRLSGHKNDIVRVMRSAPVKEKNGGTDKG